mgnify:CR=1 FL=1
MLGNPFQVICFYHFRIAADGTLKILLAPDSFKGSLSTFEICRVMAAAIASLDKGIEVLSFPLADGGEGSSAVLQHHCGGDFVQYAVHDALGRSMQGHYLAMPSGEALVEVATASGIQLLRQDELNPLKASSYGTGELIAHALEGGYRQILVTLGGSATNDGGLGLLTALGYRFFDARGNPVAAGGQGLLDLHSIQADARLPALNEAEFVVACDVDNPLTGAQGATRVFGPQKGVSDDALEAFDTAMQRYAQLAEEMTGHRVIQEKGAGAAGGIGAALMAFCHSRFQSGFSLIAEKTGFDRCLAEGGFDLVITGEGRLDAQTLNGKLPQAVAQRAAVKGVPVMAIAGQIRLTEQQGRDMGFVSCHGLGREDEELRQLIEETEPRLWRVTRQAVADFLGQQG